MTPLIVLALLLQQPPPEVKTATLQGTVTHAASQTAVRKAKVKLETMGTADVVATAESGDDGKFVVKDVKPGRYRLIAEKTGYQSGAYGARKPGDQLGQLIQVDSGAELTGLSIALPKQGIIAGKILDSESEPVAKALVLALNSVYNDGKKIRLPAGTIPVMSNDLGEYRIGQLPPGSYIVCAIPEGFYQPSTTPGTGKPASEEAAVNTCYPNLPDMTQAQDLEIKDATEIPGIDIHLIKTKTVTVKGKISGVPAGSSGMTLLSLVPKDSGPMGRAFGPRSILQGSDGRFEFKNVPPGSYILQTLPTGLGNMSYVVKSALEVTDQPLDDLPVQAVAPFEVKGHLAADASPDLKMPSVKVIASPADNIVMTFAMGSPQDNGDFVLSNIVPGRFRLVFTGLPLAYYVKEIRIGDRAAAGDEVEITSTAAQIAVTTGISKAEIAGVARNDKGDPVVAARVGLIPDPRRPYRTRLTVTDQNGIFRIASVAPGDYLILAFDQLESGALEDDEFLKPFLSKAQKLKITESGPQNLDLRVLPAADR